MLSVSRYLLPLLLLSPFAGLARAEGVASTFAGPGDTQWRLIAIVLGAITLAGLSGLIVSRIQMRRARRQIRDLEQKLADRDATAHALEETRDHLEGRVRERTADLEMSYRKLNDARDSLVAVNEKLESVARLDAMTGIANRAQFDESLETEIKRSLRSRKPLSLILIELDQFEDYRRQYGRDRADDVIVKAAFELGKTFKRAPDLIARYDDSHFGVVMPETEVRDAMRFAERLRQLVYQMCVPYPESKTTDRITASIGVATMQPDKLYSRDDFVSAATTALKEAHVAGGNTIEYGTVRHSSEIEIA